MQELGTNSECPGRDECLGVPTLVDRDTRSLGVNPPGGLKMPMLRASRSIHGPRVDT